MAATQRTSEEVTEILNFEQQCEVLQKELERKFSCSLKLRRVNKSGELPYFFIDGMFVGSPVCLTRLMNRNIFPWEKILPEFHALLEKQFGKEKYYIIPFTLEDNCRSELR